MTQEVKVTVTMTLEVDCSRMKGDIETAVEIALKKIPQQKYFDIIGEPKIKIQEERDIYGNY